MMQLLLVAVLSMGPGELLYRHETEPVTGSGLSGLKPAVTSPEVSSGRTGENLLVVFTGWPNPRETGIFSRQLNLESGIWTDPVSVSEVDAEVDTAPELWIDAQGVAHCVWRSNLTKGVHKFYYSRLEAGGTSWAAPVLVSQGSDRTAVHVRSDAVGDAVWVYNDNRPRGTLFQKFRMYASFDRGRTWEAVAPFQSLDGTRAQLYGGQVATRPGGGLVAVAMHSHSGSTSVVAATSQDGGRSWSPVRIVSPAPSPYISDVELSVQGDRALVTWKESPLTAMVKVGLHFATWALDQEQAHLQQGTIHETRAVKSFRYKLWQHEDATGATWLDTSKLNRGSVIQSKVVLKGGEVVLEEPSTIVRSRKGFDISEFDVRGPEWVVFTEKKVLNPTRLSGCMVSARTLEPVTCEELHTTSGEFDILSPLVAEQRAGRHQVIFHKIRHPVHIMQTVFETTVLTGTVEYTERGGQIGDGGIRNDGTSIARDP